jgi:capsular exopolysaccharide synthesis family protein
MILVRDYENMQKNYQALLDKRLNAHVAVNLEKRQKGEQFRVLDPANLPKKLDSPNRLLIMMLGLAGGCGLGVGLAVGLEQLNPTFRRREEIETLPSTRVLAVIPNFSAMYSHLNVNTPAHTDGSNGDSVVQLPAVRTGGSSAKAVKEGNGKGSLPPYLTLVSKWQPRSIAAEQYRMAASKLVLSTEGRDSTIVEITSALKGEGKTTTVVNLGYTIARDLGRRTLLIDCDFRCAGLHQYANVPARAGLIDFLEGKALLEECLSVIDEVPCSIISVGGSGVACNELSMIQQLKTVLPQLRRNFEYIIINTPPVLSSATMGILASLADVLILVIRAGSTPKHVAQSAFTMLGLVNQKQVILNAVEAQSMPKYMYGYGMSHTEHPIETIAK